MKNQLLKTAGCLLFASTLLVGCGDEVDELETPAEEEDTLREEVPENDE